MRVYTTLPLEVRFWRHVNKDGPTQPQMETPCWVWVGHIHKNTGYGSFENREGRTDGAHRIAWVLSNGEIPDGLHVLHHCDYRPCVRPDHLFLGTQANNVADMIAKGRKGTPKVWSHFA